MPNDAAPALKEIFDRARLRHVAALTAEVAPGFDRRRFERVVLHDLDALGIMARMRRLAEGWRAALPGDYPQTLRALRALAPRLGHAFVAVSLAEYVALYGQEHFDESMQALQFFTRFGSAEFAIRSFLKRDFSRTLAVMHGWAHDDDEHVRRLASEGCRPRLPWSFRLEASIADPSPAFGILEALKADPSLYVRKSVANHLNDVGKDHPDLLLGLLSSWSMQDARTAWITKHALRSLIKQGDADALALIGAGEAAALRVESFALTPPLVHLGGSLRIQARVVSTAVRAQRLVVDYAVHYVKKNGGSSRKVFKLKELTLEPGQGATLAVTRALRDFTTRVHYPGVHRVELLANGATLAEGSFELVR